MIKNPCTLLLLLVTLIGLGCRGQDSSGNYIFSDQETSTIASSGTTGTEVDLTDYCITGISMPADFTGVAMTFTCAPSSGGTFYALNDTAGSAISFTVADDVHIELGSSAICGCRYIKPVSGSSEGAERVVTFELGR